MVAESLDVISKFGIPLATWIFGAVVGAQFREAKQDKRITLLEECLKGEGGIYFRLRNIEAAVTARHMEPPHPYPPNRRHNEQE